MTGPDHIVHLVSAVARSRNAATLARLPETLARHRPPSAAVALIDPVVTGLCFALLLGVAAIGIVQAARGQRAITPRLIIASAMWLIAAAFLTLRPGHSGRLNLMPFDFGPSATPLEPVSNVLLFVPLGILAAAFGWRMLAVLGVGLAASVCIEVTQYVLNNGRTADVNDVIENTLGALVGGLVILAVSHRRARPKARTSDGA